MEKKYRELFDGVHASERLRTEVMKNAGTAREKPGRRIPAALIAAALAAVLTGTALAAGLGGVCIDLTDPDETNTAGSGYNGYIEYEALPAENLSEEATKRASEMAENFENWEFSSWADAEAFLGLSLENNAKLARMPQVKHRGVGCTVSVIAQPATETTPGVPVYLFIDATYQAEGCHIKESAMLTLQHPDGAVYPGGLGLAEQEGETYLEEYVTANGLETSIVTREAPIQAAGGAKSMDRTVYSAYFIRNSAAFFLTITVHDPYDHPDSVHALATLKEVLDAYE